MYEEVAWNNFLKTGSIESFLEYKKIVDLKNSSDDIENEV